MEASCGWASLPALEVNTTDLLSSDCALLTAAGSAAAGQSNATLWCIWQAAELQNSLNNRDVVNCAQHPAGAEASVAPLSVPPWAVCTSIGYYKRLNNQNRFWGSVTLVIMRNHKDYYW